jgi:hypothetical protein
MKHKISITFLILGISLLSWITSQGQPAAGVLYVKPSTSGSGDCSNWDNACTLQTALGSASDGDEIWVAAGIHKPTTGTTPESAFQLVSGVAVYGGFAGTESSRDERDWEANVTVLSGDIDGNDATDANGVITDTSNIIGTNSYHVVTGSAVTETAVLDGFTITGGSATGTWPDDSGGGMYSDWNANSTLVNVTFSGNTANYAGGGVFNSGDFTLVNVTFSGNTANEGGGMNSSEGSSATLTDVTFSGNTANDGGGMWVYAVGATLTDVTFSGNTANNDGGGMYDWDSYPRLAGVTFGGNTAKAGHGGGMYSKYGSPTLVNAIFSGNTANDDGGGMYNYHSYNAELLNTTFSANSAQSLGGGMYIEESDATIQNSILWGNLDGSSPPAEAQVYIVTSGAAPAVNYSLVQGGCPSGADCWPITYPLTDDPQFIDADGPDDVGGTADDDLRLQFTSPAVDKGDNAALPLDELDLDGDDVLTETLPLDLAGNPRISGFDVVDLGAYELDCFGSGMLRGNQFLSEGQQYRNGFHAEITATLKISDVLVSYAAIGLSKLNNAKQDYKAALECADTVSETRQALTGLLNAYWELATGAMLTGNDYVVRAMDIEYQNPYDPLQEEIGQLQDATGWYTQATGAYFELLASEYLTDAMALQPTRVSPLDGYVTPYLDLKRFALIAAKESRAYLELAERQFRQFTPASKAEAEATLRQGISLATAELALLGHLWEDVVDDVSYDALLRNISDMQRLFDHLQEGKNPFGYGPEFVPFHFDPNDLPLNNYEQTKVLADDELDTAETHVNNAVGKQQEIDDDWEKLQQSLASITSEYDDQLVDLCGTNGGGEPDLENCHTNTSGEFYRQLLHVREANDRIQLVMQQMKNQNELIRIEQQRAADVAGIQRATAELIDPETGEKYSDLMSQEKTEEMWATDQVFNAVEGCLDGMTGSFGPETILGCPLGALKGQIGGLRTLFNEHVYSDVDQRPPEEKLLEFQAWQQAQVQYAEAEITDVESEALIKQYMLRFAELDIEISIAVNNLQQELALLDGMRTQVGYLLAEKAKAEAFTQAMYQDPAGRVMRDYWMELADDRFDVALDYAYRAGRALEYEINWDPDFGSGPLTVVDDLYSTRDIYTLDAAVAQMNTAYNDFLARPDVPIPQSSDDIVYLSQALGFEDAYDPTLGYTVTREAKFNAFVSDQANWVDLDGNGEKESLRFTFQTSIFLGNKFFSTNVFNDKIESIAMRVRGTNLGDTEMYVLLRQSGTSFIRTLNAFSGQDAYGRSIDDVREYNVEPLEARFEAAVNDAPSPQANYELATRSVAFTNWTLTLDKFNEPKNSDVNITSIEEIELTITHEASTLQTKRGGKRDGDIFQPPPNRAYQPIGTASGAPLFGSSLSQPLDAASPACASSSDPTGTYFGTVVISHPVHLPAVELIVVLTGKDGNLSGYIDAAPVLDFPIVDEIKGHGPALTGSWSGDSFELQSEVYASSGVTGARQVLLHSGVISDSGQILTGAYSETVWGLTPYPLTISGDFTLLRVASPEYRVYLPLVMR